jgi:Phosphotransferase enzyme family
LCITAAAVDCGQHADDHLDFIAQVGQGKYGGVFLFGPDSSGAKHVVKLVDIANAKAVRRLCWEAEMLERARQEGGLLGSVLPDVVGLFHDEEVRPQAPVDPDVWRMGGVGPVYLTHSTAVHACQRGSEEFSESLVPAVLNGFLCRLDLDRWQALDSQAVQAHMLDGLMLRCLQGQQLGLVMERIVGRDCRDMSAAKFRALKRQAMEQFERLWDKGFMHGDPAPRNVMVTTDGMVRLVDMGHAAYVAKDVARLDRIAWERADVVNMFDINGF